MQAAKPSLDWLTDVSVFGVNRLPAHSDHRYYSTVEEAIEAGPMGMRQSLNGMWKFHYAVNPASRPERFYEQDFPAAGWGEIEVPGHIQLQGHGRPQYVNTMYPWDGYDHLRPPEIPQDHNPVGSYLTWFEVSEAMKGKPLYISFQGVESAFYVWLNGKFVGYSEDSFTPAEFDLSEHVQDGENRLAVEVYQRSTGSWLEDQDFWRFSGIFRDVYLYTVPELHVQDLSVRAELDDAYKQGSLSVRLNLAAAQRGDGGNSLIKGGVLLGLCDASGDTIASVEADLSQQVTELVLEAGEVKLWSAEEPNLYTLYIQLFDEAGRLVQVVPQRVGFRRFEMKDRIMHLNGKRIVFKGVNRHEFNCRRGRSVTKEDMLWDIRTIKQNNLNAVRTSHYPNQSLWYELCDEYGIYLIDEMNLETHGSWQKMGAVEPSWVVPGSRPEWEPIVMDRAISMYERDKNHPSILIWSCGNESYAGEVLLNVTKYFHSVDPSRLVHYEGVFYDRNYSATSDMESRMYAKPAQIEEYLQNDPEKPYISCEYMHAMGNSVGGMHKYTELEQKYPMYQGGFIWDYIDQAIMKKNRYGEEYLAYGGDFDDRATDYNFCGNGIVYADRKVSPKMQEVKFLYQNIKLTADREGVTVKNENLFTGTDAYELVCTLYREGEALTGCVIELNVEAQEEGRVLHDLPQPAEPGEYTIDASLQLRESNLWADAGHEVAFGQHVFVVEKSAAAAPVGSAAGANGLRLVEGDVNIGVHGRDFSVLFSKGAGSLVSLSYAGREMIAYPPAPQFWRASTDNDKGARMGFERGVWFMASHARRCTDVKVTEEESGITVAFEYRFAVSEEVRMTVAYTVLRDGSVRVVSRYEGTAGLPDIPIVGVSFKVPADYDQLEWYAMGPKENYSDRAHGARLCTFRNTAADNVAGYLVPQESGNRTGVRRVSITDKDGRGIRLTAPASQPVECSISPYTAFELENANHPYELPPVHYTVITVAGRQMGVGGDDSWGAPVHEEYRIKADEDLAFAFTIERI
ncbi:beta-galactosidase [Paenibacillus sambharensis]|uniref:Beta-galactosidase n=1 Tax=Paenibacillus sambharensis TaxID=1803190 RepID=A0A2W1LDY1_9BACL|nr:glycoside hydrolase family 2 TIM barrel-domain containing protein [Paenibacillus sambharensis]PZD96869.1 beta-galactosidase [Paenibacillus sambharensis]